MRAAFLWSRCRRKLSRPMPETLLAFRSWVEERLFGSLDGIRLGGEETFELLY